MNKKFHENIKMLKWWKKWVLITANCWKLYDASYNNEVIVLSNIMFKLDDFFFVCI